MAEQAQTAVKKEETPAQPPVLTPAAAQAAALVEAAQLKLLDPNKLRFFRSDARLRLTVDGDASHLKVSCLRAFPLTHPDRYISIRDGANKEIGMLVDPSALDAEGRRLLQEDIDRRYMVSVIKRIVWVKERFGTLDWQVETQRGVVKFTTRELRENVLRPSRGRLVFTDVDGNRFDVPKISALDGASQAYLMQHV